MAGGGNLTEGGLSNVPTKTAVVVDVNGATSVAGTSSMSVGRRQHNLTVLADGSVLATGGESRSIDALVDLANPVFAAERWNPSAGAWTVLASASRVRQYHSSAALLPDGRVLTGGGGICGVCVTKGYLEKNIEYFTPPYLYKNDGSGQLASRPVIDSAPAIAGYGQGLSIASAQASTIAKVGLVRLGAPTHSEDQGQRYVPLSFSVSGTTITATSPATSNLAPAGYYMLFVTDAAGVPSVAKIVKLDRGGGDTTPPTVTARAPLVDATNVGATANVRATFSEVVTGVSDTSFTLKNAATGASVASVVSRNGTINQSILTPNATLAADTRYTATLTGGPTAIRDAAGNPLVTTSWSFITGPRPTVTARTPAVNATGVSRTANVTATFSEAVRRVIGSTYRLKNASTGRVITAVVSRNGTTNQWILNPSATLTGKTRFTVTLTGGATGIRDEAGNPLTTAAWSFTTRA